MDLNTSLCITYMYFEYSSNRSWPSLYRVADYIDGCYCPVDPQKYTDSGDVFSPKFLRVRPGDETELYQPVLKQWKAVPKAEDSDRMTTESYPFQQVDFFEIVIDPSNMASDIEEWQKRMRRGIHLPKGINDLFLLAVDQDETSYTVAVCRKSLLKRQGDLFSFGNGIGDMLHMIHYLDTYVIDKQDVFDTSRFTGLYTENRQPAEKRYFYKYDHLPDSDGRVYLYEIKEYVPFLVSRFLKSKRKQYEFTYKQIQRISAAVDDALQSQESIATFFNVTGYDVDKVKELLLRYSSEISEALLDEDEINLVITGIMENNEQVCERFTSLAKERWLAKADQDRELKESEIRQLTANIESESAHLERVKGEKKATEEELAGVVTTLGQMRKEQSIVEATIQNVVDHFEEEVASRIIDHTLLQSISGNAAKSDKTEEEAKSHLICNFPSKETEPPKQTDELPKIIAAMQANFRKIGMTSYSAGVVTSLICEIDTRTNAFVISGLYASLFANAISSSLFGRDAARITIINPQPDYMQIKRSIEASQSSVVIIENLLDYCDESLFASLAKDYKDRIIVFSVDNDDSLSVLSKSIWNYATYINTDIVFEDIKSAPALLRTEYLGEIVRQKGDYRIEGYDELNSVLMTLGIPLFARKSLIATCRFFDQDKKTVSFVDFIDSVIAKLCSVYQGTLSEDGKDLILDKLSDDVAGLYFQ